MSTKEERFAQLRQKGFVKVDKWKGFSEEKQQHLLGVLRNDPKITELNLSGCGIGDRNAAVLAGHLKNNTHLTWLGLHVNKLNNAGVPIAQALANHPTLEKLYLSYNEGITDASCPALAQLLRTVPTLERLHLTATSITGKGEAVLAAALGRTELGSLNIEITPEERARLAQQRASDKPSAAAASTPSPSPPKAAAPPSARQAAPAVTAKPQPPPVPPIQPTPSVRRSCRNPAAQLAASFLHFALLNPKTTTAFDIFISLRFGEAMDEAVALQAALQQRGLSVFVCDVEPGGDIAKAVISALANCKLAVILGTKTYGQQTASSFSSFEELRYIIEEKKPFFLVKMCDAFVEHQTKFWLPSTVSYYLWKPVGAARKQVPGDLVEQIVRKHSAVVHGITTPLPTSPTQPLPKDQHGVAPGSTAAGGGDLATWLAALDLGRELDSVKKALSDIGIDTMAMLREAVREDMVSEAILKDQGVKPIPARVVMRTAGQLR